MRAHRKHSCRLPLLGALLICTLAWAPKPVHAQIRLETVASGLEYPVFVAAVPGDTERLFIVEWRGRIRILTGGALLTRPFLDIQDRVFFDAFERGFLGLAFDPDFQNNGWFYVYYINRRTPSGSSVIRRFTVSDDPDVADPDSMVRIFTEPQFGGDHNGAHIEFGPDGYLYLGMGEGGIAQNGRSQDLGSLFGKMLRLDPYGDDFPEDSRNNYAIPPSNPFVGTSNVRGEIWALGLRNPYRFSFDSANGDLYIGDVGHGHWEEVDWQAGSSAGGQNYGWRHKEGTHCFDPRLDCEPGGLTEPFFEYGHDKGFAITGGRVYRGNAIPDMRGRYVFGDYITDFVWSFRVDGANLTDLRDHTPELDPQAAMNVGNIVAFGEDGLGELYVVDMGGGTNGRIFKMVSSAPTPLPPRLRLSNARPNPFAGDTRLLIDLDSATDLDVGVYSLSGRLVRRLLHVSAGPGSVTITWNGEDATGSPVPAGMYMIRAKTGFSAASRRVTLLR